MKIITWNMNYWQNTHIYDSNIDRFKLPGYKDNIEEVNVWINNCKKYIEKLNFDILLLQEINPMVLFGEKYEKSDDNQYEFIKGNNIIIYHELYNELISEKLEGNYWGNAIIVKNSFDAVIVIQPDNNDYYGRNGLMFYDIVRKYGPSLSLINYYNKKNRNKNFYSMPYEMKEDLKGMVKENGRFTIFAGDFNSDKDRDLSSKIFFDFIEELGFENFTIGEEFMNTMVAEAKPYPNDKIYLKNIDKEIIKNIKCQKLTDTNIKYSDHYPIKIEIIENDEIEKDRKFYINKNFWDVI